MEIYPLIDREYFLVPIQQDLPLVYDLLKQRPCYVVMDTGWEVAGIVTLNDFPFQLSGKLIDIDFKKPALSSNSTIMEALDLMKLSESSFLPVYDEGVFVGTISLLAIAEHVLGNDM